MTFSDLVFIDDSGYHYADYPTILTWLQDQYKSIYGEDVYLEPDSQDGQWLAIQARYLYDSAVLGAAVFNSNSPVTAQGVGLSRNVKLNGLNRRAPTYSTVDVLIVGTAGTVIGSIGSPGVAQDVLDQKWIIPIGTTIPGGGSITVTATSEVIGAIRAESNSVNKIFTPTRGWQTVNNPTPATVGVSVETDAELRVRQSISTANPSKTVLQGTEGAVANLTGVTGVRAYENDTNSVDGNGIPAHSISVVVIGGVNSQIAETILLHKTPGCGTFGDQSVTVTDPRGVPTVIEFERPAVVPINVEIIITPGDGYSSDYADQIKTAIVASINLLGIGDDVIYTKLFIPAYLAGTPAFGTFDVVSVEISRDADPVAAANVAIDWNEYATCVVGDVTVID